MAPVGVLELNRLDRPELLHYNWGLRHGSTHVLLSDIYTLESEGVTLLDWITQMVDDDPNWANVAPAYP